MTTLNNLEGIPGKSQPFLSDSKLLENFFSLVIRKTLMENFRVKDYFPNASKDFLYFVPCTKCVFEFFNCF